MVRYIIQFIFFFSYCILTTRSFAQLRVVHLLCNNRVAALGLGDAQPQLSWRLEDTGYNIHQAAYELRVKGAGVDWWSDWSRFFGGFRPAPKPGSRKSFKFMYSRWADRQA